MKASTADGKSVEFTTTTNADGEYIFENLDTYVYRDKTYYLASYKVEVVNTDGMNPDRDQYAITKYLVNSNDYRNSHLLADESMEDKYFIVAQQVTNKNHPYIRTVDKMSYDLIHHEDVQN